VGGPHERRQCACQRTGRDDVLHDSYPARSRWPQRCVRERRKCHPVIGFISAHRAWLFVTTGLLLTLSWAVMAGRLPAKWLGAVICPPGRASPTTRRLWWVSVGVYGVALGASFGAPIARSIWK